MEIIRQDYRLPALRFSMEFVNREPFVRIRAYHGREELAGESIPAAEIGISERLSVDAYRDVQFNLPQEVIKRLDDVLRPVRQGGPVMAADRPLGWLPRGSALGAAVGPGDAGALLADSQFSG